MKKYHFRLGQSPKRQKNKINALVKKEVYFSLYDDPEAVIIKHIDEAEEFISIAMYAFTDVEIAQAIFEARDRGNRY